MREGRAQAGGRTESWAALWWEPSNSKLEWRTALERTPFCSLRRRNCIASIRCVLEASSTARELCLVVSVVVVRLPLSSRYCHLSWWPGVGWKTGVCNHRPLCACAACVAMVWRGGGGGLRTLASLHAWGHPNHHHRGRTAAIPPTQTQTVRPNQSRDNQQWHVLPPAAAPGAAGRAASYLSLGSVIHSHSCP